MKTNKRYFSLLALAAMFSTAAYAGDVVKDTLGTTASSAKTVETLLQGQVAGVRVWSQDGSPMSASGVSIRGVNSLRGGQQPLYIVDGVMLNDSNSKNNDPLWQYEGAAYATPLSQLSFLTPNDIESIEVLKNASATALYGSKGANGVIIITTKKVKSEKPVIAWDSNLEIAAPNVADDTQVGISHNHRVMFGGAKNNSTYTLSGYFRDDNYVIPGTGSMKGGLRASFETKANPVVWFGLNSNVSVGTTEETAAATWYGNDSYTINMRNPNSSVDNWAVDYDDDAIDFRAVNSMCLKLNLAKGFSFKFDLGTDFMSHLRSFWWGLKTNIGKEYNGMAANVRTSVFAYNASGVFDYSAFIANNHKLSVSLGAQALGNMEMLNTVNGNNFFDHALRANGLSLAGSKAKLHKFNLDNFTLGMFGALSYNYKDIVGADVAYRTDYTPLYGNWRMYPSVSAYWDIKNTFFKSADIVSSLKVNAGYGESGRQEAMPYALFGNYTAGSYLQLEDGAHAFHDGLTYQHSKEWNVSLALGLLNDRFTIEAGYYQRRTDDQLDLFSTGEQFVNVPEVDDEEIVEGEGDDVVDDTPVVGEVLFWQYADRKVVSSQRSTVANDGVELSLNAVPVQTKDWTWAINLNGAYNFSRIAKLDAADQGGKGIGNFAGAPSIVASANIEGSPVSSFVDENGDILGNPTPKYYYGVSSALRWKDLTLDILADGAAGYNILNLNQMYLNNAGKVTGTYVENGDFFRIARVSLAYNIPVKNVKWMEAFKVFATASNLAVFSSYTGWSPDVNSYAASNFHLGMDYGSYPAARSFVLGLSIKF